MSKQLRRNERGTKAKDLNNWAQIKIEDLSGPFAAQEFLQSQINRPD